MATLTLKYNKADNSYSASHQGNAVHIGLDLTVPNSEPPYLYAYCITGAGDISIHCGKLFITQAVEDVADILDCDTVCL